MRLCRLLTVRNHDKKAKKAIVLSDASCMKEWVISCFPKGPFLRVLALGSVDLQWGLYAGWCGMIGSGDSPSTDGGIFLGMNPCAMKWL